MVRSAEEFEEALVDDREKRIIFQPDDFESINELFEMVFRYGNIIVLLDEAEIWIGAKDYNVQRSGLLQCVQFGRHRGIDLIFVARRAVELNIFIRAQCTQMITFQQTEARDRGRLAEYGFDVQAVNALQGHDSLSITF